MQPTAGRGSPQRITALPDESGNLARSAAHTLKEPRQSSLAPVQPASELNLRPGRRRSVRELRAPAPKHDHASPALAREPATSGRSGKALSQSRKTGSTSYRHVRSSRHPRVCHPDRPPSSLERAAVPRVLAVMAGPSSPVSPLSHPKAPLQLVLRRPPGCRWSAPGSRDRFCTGLPHPFPSSRIVAPSPEGSETAPLVGSAGSVRPSLHDRRPSACDGLVIPPPVPQAVRWQCTRMQWSRRGPRATAETVPTCPPQPKPRPTYAAGCVGRSPRNRAVRDRSDAAEAASRHARRPVTLQSRRTSTSPTSQPSPRASWWFAPSATEVAAARPGCEFKVVASVAWVGRNRPARTPAPWGPAEQPEGCPAAPVPGPFHSVRRIARSTHARVYRRSGFCARSLETLLHCRVRHRTTVASSTEPVFH